MKKLFFIAMIVLGTSLAQAQVQDGDYLRAFRFSDTENATQNRYHLFGDNFDHCPTRLENPGVVIEYTYDRTTRQIYVKNGSESIVTSGSPLSRRQGNGLIITFDRTDLNQVFITGRRGNILSEITGFTTN